MKVVNERFAGENPGCRDAIEVVAFVRLNDVMLILQEADDEI